MTYDVLIENGGRKYQATVLGWPSCSAEGATREQALSNLRELLRERLAKTEIVQIEVEAPPAEDPWLRFAGMFRDNPVFDEVVAEIEADRRRAEPAEDDL